MVDVTDQGGRIEERKDMGEGDTALWAYWAAQEKIAEKEERNWVKKARTIVERYRDERPDAQAQDHRFNILWSNVQTLLPTLYARTPKPDVERRFRDADPVGRLAATLIERCLSYFADHEDFDAAMRAVTQDKLLPGRGVARVLYVPHFGDPISEGAKGEDAENDEADGSAVAKSGNAEAEKSAQSLPAKAAQQQEPDRYVDWEEAVAKYVFWEDYREGPARQWREVPWVRYRTYETRDELIKRFGAKKGKEVNLDYTPTGIGEKEEKEAPPDIYKKGQIHETWDKTKREVVWWAPGTPNLILDRQPDPLRLADFFANPDPLLATTTNDKRIPVPDYIEYQDQARELDNITARIDNLVTALKVVGIYPGENKRVLQQLFDSPDNKLIPVEDWAAYGKSGDGLKGMILWLPIEQVAQVLIQLYNARDRVKALLYEITGLSDILRGATVPTETLGAQELKANFATRRIAPQQRQVARFARDLFRLMGGVIAEHFAPKTISMITGYPQLDPVPALPPQPNASIAVKVGALISKFANDLLAMLPAVRSVLEAFVSAIARFIPTGAPGTPPQASPGPPAPPGGGPPVGGPAAQPSQPQQPQQPQQDSQVQAYQQAMAQWQQQMQQVQAVMSSNDRKTKEFQAACDLIRKDGCYGFRIDIEADSTIAPDEDAEKKARIEFLSQMVPLLNQVVPLAQGNPALAELAKEIALFAARGFRVARPMEETFERAFDAIGKMQPNAKATGQPPDKGQQGPHPAEIAADVAVKSRETDANTAVKTREIASKEAIERMKIGQQATDNAADRSIEVAKLATTQENEHAHLMLDIEAGAREAARNDAVAQHKASMDAKGLE